VEYDAAIVAICELLAALCIRVAEEALSAGADDSPVAADALCSVAVTEDVVTCLD